MVSRTVVPFEHEVADRRPHLGAAHRVEAGRRLVEKKDLRVGDEACREVETPPHAPRVALHELVPSVDEIELLEKFVGPPPRDGSSQVGEATDDLEVLVAGEELVHGRGLPGHADLSPYLVRLRGDVEAGDLGVAAVRVEQCREDPHRRCLPGAVASEQRADTAGGHVEAHVNKRVRVTEGTREMLRRDREGGHPQSRDEQERKALAAYAIAPILRRTEAGAAHTTSKPLLAIPARTSGEVSRSARC